MAECPTTNDIIKYLKNQIETLKLVKPAFEAKLTRPELFDFKLVCESIHLIESQKVAIETAVRVIYYTAKQETKDLQFVRVQLRRVLDIHKRRIVATLRYRQHHGMVDLNPGEFERVTAEITAKVKSFIDYYYTQ